MQMSSSPKVHSKQRKLVNPSSYYPLLLLFMVHGANAKDIPDSHSSQPLISLDLTSSDLQARFPCSTWHIQTFLLVQTLRNPAR